MSIDERIQSTFEQAIEDFVNSASFAALVQGSLPPDEVRAFVRHLFLPHYQSAHILAFGYALLPSEASELIKYNMLEEMGEDGEGPAHPRLLIDLARGVGFSAQEVRRLIQDSEEQARAFCATQIPFPTLRDAGLAILLESAAFEHFLSRHAGAIGHALATRYAVSRQALAWFDLHGELDVRHAEESMTVLREYAAFHRVDEAHLERILRAVFADNPFARRYFPPRSTPSTRPAGRIEAMTVFLLQIPFREAFRHAQIDRAASDAIVVRVRDHDGNVGYGEALPRDYVTGEDAASVVAHIKNELAPWIFGADFGPAEQVWDAVAAYGTERVQAKPAAGGIHTAAFCAVELALLDLAYGKAGLSIATALPPARAEVAYSGVISADEPAAAADLARRFVEAGLDQLKVKVGVGDDVARVRAVREAVGDAVHLRADANGAWEVDDAIAQLARLAPYGLEFVEQPVSHLAADHVARLRAVREGSRIGVVADESLVTVDDARVLATAQACDVFNVRVSKNGGLTGALAIARVGLEAGIRVQVGAQVGETAVLTAAGRHLAAHVSDLAFAEGSFGTLLLAEDIAEQEMRFGVGGVAPTVTGPGLGIRVRPDALERLAVETIEIHRES